MQLGDLPAAEQAVRRAVELAPNDATSYMLLATLCYSLERIGEAESFFKAAISADPVPSEPYYNLALLCSRDKRMEDARKYYQQALERGALPGSRARGGSRRIVRTLRSSCAFQSCWWSSCGAGKEDAPPPAHKSFSQRLDENNGYKGG